MKHPFLFAVMKIIMGAYGNDAAAALVNAADANVWLGHACQTFGHLRNAYGERF